MSRGAPPQPLGIAIAVLAGVIVLGISSWVMASAARPKDYKERLAALELSVTEIERGAAGQQVAGFDGVPVAQVFDGEFDDLEPPIFDALR